MALKHTSEEKLAQVSSLSLSKDLCLSLIQESRSHRGLSNMLSRAVLAITSRVCYGQEREGSVMNLMSAICHQ